MKSFITRPQDVARRSIEMLNVQTLMHTIKRKCKFLYNIMSSKNVLCEMCQEFTEKEPRVYSSASVNNSHHFVTGPPNGPVLLSSLTSVVCRRRLSSAAGRVGGRQPPTDPQARGQSSGRLCTAGQYGYVPLG